MKVGPQVELEPLAEAAAPSAVRAEVAVESSSEKSEFQIAEMASGAPNLQAKPSEAECLPDSSAASVVAGNGTDGVPMQAEPASSSRHAPIQAEPASSSHHAPIQAEPASSSRDAPPPKAIGTVRGPKVFSSPAALQSVSPPGCSTRLSRSMAGIVPKVFFWLVLFLLAPVNVN